MKNKLILILIAYSGVVFSQAIKKPLVSAITDKDLRTDMYQMAGDHFNGREAGTLDELKVSMWLANKAKEAGMTPAGDDGTYFQFFDMYRHQVTANTTFKIGQKEYKLWKEVLVAETTNIKVEGSLVYLGAATKEQIEKSDVKGKVVVLLASKEGIADDISLFDRRYPGLVRNKYYDLVVKKGAVALIMVADELAEQSWSQVEPQMTRGIYGIEGFRDKIGSTMPVFWVHGDQLEYLKNTKDVLSAEVVSESYKYPSVNIVGTIAGTDPKLKNEYVLFSGHQDHDGVRQKYGKDSIYNGADDNASTCVAMLAIARAYKKQPGKRTALFVFHGSEERGLLGSRWYAAHSTVPEKDIVAVLNGDMIGRNNVNQAALLGSSSPHENSSDLVAIAKKANDEGPKFDLDKLWDRPEHPEYFYFRSDHLPYARRGIPSVFFTSVLHSQYHTPMDEAENIDYVKLHKMTEWMYRTGWILSNDASRPKTLPNVQLER
ncbi:M28 family peptidase [Flavobacterium sp. JLP]|uniref:M28 family peptidase n=1 Tax=unclassified Flavobacterium TaxID=196869 RepID=UPI00188DB623|nr:MULTISPECIES: M28 family peptidase [unclassified Flavobacterium]MBF4494008.1 M28 family peptidase [Flavobacterium sp. MR2016-29]MBF4506722.1 M28 family peptidase [Flavobacterium sp. JLP]